MMAEAKITIIHANGHITESKFTMPDCNGLVMKVRLGEVLLNDIMENLSEQLIPGSKVYLTIKSKHQ